MNRLKLPKQVKQKKAIIAAIVFILLLAVFTGVRLRPRGLSDEDVIWREYQVERKDIIASLDGSGKLEACGVQHSFDIDMKIEQVFVKVGDQVKKGDKLVQYSREAVEKQIEEQEKALETAKHALEEAKNSRRSSQLQNSLNRNQNQQTSKNTYETQKRELENTIDTLKRKTEQLRANLDTLKLALKNAEDDCEDILKLKKELKQLQEELAELETSTHTAEDGANPVETNPNETDFIETIQSEDNLALIQKKKKQIEDIQSRIQAAEEKENQIAALKEQINQVQTDLENTDEQLETQKKALSQLNTDYEKQVAENKKNQGIQDELYAISRAGQDYAVESAQTEVDKCRTKLQEVKELLNTPNLIAKTDGIVTKIDCAPGDEAAAGSALITIGDSGQKQVIVLVSQENITSVEVGQQVEVRFLTNVDQSLTGTVTDKSLLPEEGGDVSYKVTITLDEDNPELLQGMTCSVKFILKKVENVLVLSNKAILLRDGKQVVTVQLPDGSRQERVIQTGFSDGRVSEITDGLAEGDIVVVEG